MDGEIKRYRDIVLERNQTPIWEKKWLSIKEAAAYSGIGQIKISELTMRKKCPFVVMNGTQICIVRQKFDEYIDKQFRI